MVDTRMTNDRDGDSFQFFWSMLPRYPPPHLTRIMCSPFISFSLGDRACLPLVLTLP